MKEKSKREEDSYFQGKTTLYLNEEIERAQNGLTRVRRAMAGVGTTFLISSDSLAFTEEEIAGIGELLQLFSGEIQKVENILSQDSQEATDN